MPPACPKGPERILVVDDNSNMRAYLCHLLERRCRVDPAHDGQAALARMQEQHYDLPIVDVMMPLMNGLELLSR